MRARCWIPTRPPPWWLARRRHAGEAFIGYLVEASAGGSGARAAAKVEAADADPAGAAAAPAPEPRPRSRRLQPAAPVDYLWREALELQRDPVRARAGALVGSLVLMS